MKLKGDGRTYYFARSLIANANVQSFAKIETGAGRGEGAEITFVVKRRKMNDQEKAKTRVGRGHYYNVILINPD